MDEDSHFEVQISECCYFRNSLYKQQQHGENTDFEIVVSGKEIPVHRCVMVVSPYFDKLFASSMSEMQQGKACFNQFSYEEIKGLIRFCYGQLLEIKYENVSNFYMMFDYFLLGDFKDFKAHFSMYVNDHLTLSNCISWAKFAARYDLVDILKDVGDLVRKRFTDFVQLTEFQQLSSAEVMEMLDKMRELASEYSCDMSVQGLIHWLKANPHISMSKLFQSVKSQFYKGCSLLFLQSLSATYKQETFWDESWSEEINREIIAKTKIKNFVFLIGNLEQDMPPKCGSLDITTGIREPIQTLAPIRGKVISACQAPGGFAVLTYTDSLQGSTACIFYNDHEKAWSEPLVCPDTIDSGTTLVYAHTYIALLGNNQGNKDVCYIVHAEDCTPGTLDPSKVMIFGMSKPIAASIGNVIYVIWNTFNNEFRITYPLQTFDEEWVADTLLPDDINNTDGATLAATNTNLYLVGGVEKLAYRITPKDGGYFNFERISRPINVHVFGAAAFIDNAIVLCGGYRDKEELHVTDNVEWYNGVTNRWEVKTIPLPMPLHHHYILPRV